MSIRRYSKLITFPEFSDRLNYLQMYGEVCVDTFGSKRYLNQILYLSPEWKRVRRQVIERDDGCDLGIPELPILGHVFIHHINPLTIEDVVNRSSKVFDLENLICCSFRTHNWIHYGVKEDSTSGFTIRSKNDTCPWKRKVNRR